MATLNYAFKEISCKIVYYGCGLCGKTTNLIHVHKTVPDKFRGELVSLATEQDRTLFFDFLPLDLGEVKGFKTKFQLYTVPGQVYYNATRKLVLRGVDGLVFVADSQKDRLQENVESFENLKLNLQEYGYHLQRDKSDDEGVPWILQLNKRDMPQIASAEEIVAALGIDKSTPIVDAVAVNGIGVKETLKGISSLVIQRLDSGPSSLAASKSKTAAPTAAPAAPAPPPTAAPAEDEYEAMSEEELADEKLEKPAAPAKAAAQTAAPAKAASPAAPAKAASPAAPAPKPNPEAPAPAPAPEPEKPAVPELSLTQACSARWRGMRTGSGEITLSNMAGTNELQITGSLAFLGVFKRSLAGRLAFEGRVMRTLDGEQGEYLSFHSSDSAASPRIQLLVHDAIDKRAYMSYHGFGGEVVATPTDKSSMPS